MKWLTPLGFLALLAILILILIYILKPNYQQKIISSTYVWKLSLKYRKKRIPINKFRNILIFICQVLIFVLCAAILAQPFIPRDRDAERPEKIVIIDGSASMYAAVDGETRFDRAVEGVRSLAEETLKEDGIITVILATDKTSYVVQRAGADMSNDVIASIDELVDPDDVKCSYGTSDIEGAINVARDIVEDNPKAEVILYTDTKYIEDGDVTIVDVSMEGEWNAAILNCEAVLDENFYIFRAEVVSYGRDKDVLLHCNVNGANYEGSLVNMVLPVRCDNDQSTTVEFVCKVGNSMGNPIVYQYDSVYFYIEEDDSYTRDNRFYLYDGAKTEIKVQYYSTARNSFVSGFLMDLQNEHRDYFDIVIKELKPGQKPEIEGFDYYIFEHGMPETMPTDGVVFLLDPLSAPENSGIRLGDQVVGEFTLAAGQNHPVTDFVTASEINVTAYTRITVHDGFEPLLYCGGDPVLLVKNEDNLKVVVLAFSLHYSDLPILLEYPILMSNLFDYYIPATLDDHVFDVNDTVSLNARASSLRVTDPLAESLILTDLPNELELVNQGTYAFAQRSLRGIDIVEYIYVKTPAQESNIFRVEEKLTSPYVAIAPELPDYDLLIYVAAALVALLFAEWWLQSREHF